jgi:hypothetical protein
VWQSRRALLALTNLITTTTMAGAAGFARPACWLTLFPPHHHTTADLVGTALVKPVSASHILLASHDYWFWRLA